MDLARLFSAVFPIRSEQVSLELVSESVDESTGEVSGGTCEDSQGYWRATLRLIVWEHEGGGLQIRDIKEQQIVWLYPELREDPRVPAYIAGWAAAVQYVFDRHSELAAAGDPRGGAQIDVSMPHDFFDVGVLKLRRPQTEGDFTDALLSSKKRLGKLLP